MADDGNLADEWIAQHKVPTEAYEGTASEFLDWLVVEDPLNALRTMFRISEKTDDKNLLGLLGAGPLENLLGSAAGADYVDEVIERATDEKNWRIAFGCVWTTSFTDNAVAKKIEKNLNAFFPDGRP